jgi:uncharacterized membrane protein YfcA
MSMRVRFCAATLSPLSCVAFGVLVLAQNAWGAGSPMAEAGGSGLPTVWGWALAMFAFCVLIGVAAVIAGVGGGVLFVPLVGAFFPFHMDFVRGAALFVALSGALSASSRFLREGLSFPRLVLPLSVASSLGAIAGAAAGLALPENTVRVLLGIVIVGICVVMVRFRRRSTPVLHKADPVAAALKIEGVFHDPATGSTVTWQPRRMPLAITLFIGIGFLAGMFGLGAGWANVPVLNLVMGVPLKAAVASSLLVISISDTAPALVYLNSGAVLPAIAVPSVIGMMVGSRIGLRLVHRMPTATVRWFVIGLLALAGAMSLLKGLGVLAPLMSR